MVMIVEKLDNLRRLYFEAILSVDNDDEMYSLLPPSTGANFTDILRGVVQLLKNELNDYQRELISLNDEELKEMYREEIGNLTKKMNVCQKLLSDRYVIPSEEESKFDETKKINIIFGVNPAGNITFFNDLKKNIDEHYFKEVLLLIEQLESGIFITNPEKVRKFTSVNGALQGLSEVKSYQIRIIFRQLPNNIIYVEMIRIKKDDWSLKDSDEPAKRSSLLAKDYESVRRKIKNNESIEDILITNEELLAEIKDYIHARMLSGGKKHGE